MTSRNPIADLRRIVAEAHESPRSRFYSDRYAGHVGPGFPVSLSEGETLPFITKETLTSTPFRDRLFVPFRDAHSIRMSSGTSGRGIVLIPRNFHVDRTYYLGKFSCMLSFYIPHFGMDEACEPLGLGHVGAIPDDLPATARMASLLGVDALAGAVSPILAFAPVLAARYDCTRIRYIHLWGERPSQTQFTELHTRFPQAELTWEYSNIEANGQSGRPCEELAKREDDRVHPLTDRYYWELIDPESGSVITGEDIEGEIVLTTLWSGNALPVLRYRTGDLARRTATTCGCDAETFQILGRVAYDRAVIPGGELKSEELERVLAPFADDIDGDFELHVSGSQPTILTLHVRPRRQGVDLEAIRAHLEATMRIGATRTLAHSVASGAVKTMIVSDTQKAGKVRRIVAEPSPPRAR